MSVEISSSRDLLCLSLFLVLLMLKTSSLESPPTYLYSSCVRYEVDSNTTYQANVDTLLGSFVSKTTTFPPGGYYKNTAGKGTGEAVYGFFLCRGDQNATGCGDCVNTAAKDDLPNTYCPGAKQAVIWYNECMLRYSNESFLDTMSSDPMGYIVGSESHVGDRTVYNNAMYTTMNSMLADTANNNSGMKFTTKEVNITSSIFLYALQQCTPDITPNDCKRCLRNAIDQLTLFSSSLTLSPSCYVRYESFPFYNGAINYSSSTPAGEPITIKIENTCDYAVWPVIVRLNVNETSNIALYTGKSYIINIQQGHSIKMWGRTHCSTNILGNFSCLTGDGSMGKVSKWNVTSAATQVEFSFGELDYYDVSVKNGYNFPVLVAPQGGNGDTCAATGCVFNLKDGCPDELRVGNQTLIGCNSPCVALHSDNPCCTSPAHCNGNSLSLGKFVFKDACPRAVTFAFDSTPNFSCSGTQRSYTITFCPSPSLARALSEPFPRSSASLMRNKSKASKTKVVAISVPIAVLVLIICSCICHFRMKAKKYLSLDIRNVHGDFITAESLMFELRTLQAATNNFSDDQKLGGGGFGNVYKGILSNGQEIAVKRLTRFSDHGVEAFKNEAILIAKLQHNNLVRLLGFCSAREERLLVYEFVPNKSLDYLLFDPRKQKELDWPIRYNIILGIARGLLYLHEDSRPRIIHRDLKAPNILLEADMNPKISDFGLARIFKFEQAEHATSVIAGTFGYIAPEYAMHGQFSIKSDAYSFGVLLLEIVSGKKINNRSPLFGEGDLFTYAWRSWNDGKPFEILDPTLRDSSSREEVLRCIHLGLLCVQESSHQRPTMSTIIFMLNTESTTNTLPKPECPRSFYSSNTDSSQATSSNMHSQDPTSHTHNKLTISDMDPR